MKPSDPLPSSSCTPPKASYLPLLISILVLMFSLQGAVLLVPYVRACRNANETKRWPTTSGQILGAQLRDVPSAYRKFRVEISYRYQVGETVFHSTQMYPPPVAPTLFRSKGEKLLDQFPIGGTVSVSYSPTDPQNAVLLPGLTQGHLAALAALAGWVFLPAGLVGWYWLHRRRRRPDPREVACGEE